MRTSHDDRDPPTAPLPPVAAAPDKRYAFVSVRELRDDPAAETQQLDPVPDDGSESEGQVSPRRAGGRATKRPARAQAKPTRAAKRPQRRRRAELGLGALLVMAAVGWAVYVLLHRVVEAPRDWCLVAAGLAAGLTTRAGAWLTAARVRLAAAIHPGGGRP
ncbi:hypothetical protein JOL79_06705 [Microbispora sp. RL4-1S]|uniref:Uncharacterized protein n=1 Tax=Microbispora oryzae TaxID=2806554 RepID=A0A940WG91_9ACTN|nr:hypothetical protein [Microbispora oryzae]MBP2703487.1 hypothetical protein [Microbispora oryzae]